MRWSPTSARLGYCLTGDTSEQAIFFNHGVGANGKTVLMATVSGILGDYSVATPIETFTESQSDRHPTELARLRGARLVTATETEAGRHWAESRLKEITGGEKVPARFMHQDFRIPAAVQAVSSPATTTPSAQRRRRNAAPAQPDPFRGDHPQGRARSPARRKLKDEWPGILQWMIDGASNGGKAASTRRRRSPRRPTPISPARTVTPTGLPIAATRSPALDALDRPVRLVEGVGGKGRPDGRQQQPVSRGNGAAWRHS